MSTQTPVDAELFGGVDVPASLERWRQTARQVTHRYLDLYTSTVGRIADAQVESARAAKVPALVPIAESSAAIRRDVCDAYVTTIRDFIDS
jgi:hypothetical protein